MPINIDWESLGKFVTSVGIPFVLLVLVLFGIYKLIREVFWPFIVSQQEKSEKSKEQERLDRIAERDKFIEYLASRDDMMKESLSTQNNALEESTKNVVAALNILTTEVKKNGNNGRK